MLRRVSAVARKELLQILHDPRALVVAILMPPLMIILYGYGVNLDVRNVPLAVYDADHSPLSRAVVTSFEAGGYFRVRRVLESPAEADGLLEEARVRSVLWIPASFEADLRAGRTPTVQLITDGSDSNTAILTLGYASGIVRTFAGRYLAERLALSSPSLLAPIDLRIRYWYNPELRSTNFVLPGLIVIVLMMLSALLTSVTIVREREQGTLARLRLSPLGGTELVVGKMVPYVGIAFAAVMLAVLVGQIVFRVPIRGSPALLLALTGLFLFSALGTGLLISAVTRSQQIAIFAAFLLTFLPAVLLTGFVFPVERMPLILRVISELLPARHYMIVVRGIYLLGIGLDRLWEPVLILVGFAIIIPAAAGLALRRGR